MRLKMHVRHRNELVNLSLEDDVNPLELTGKHLSPVEFYEQMQSPDTVVIDARNDYEFDVGHFRGQFVLILRHSVNYLSGFVTIKRFLKEKNPDLLHRRRTL